MRPVRLEVQRLPGHADLPLPAQQTADAAGLDLRAAETSTIVPGGIVLVATGLAIAIPTGYEGQIRARSGLATRHGITPINSPGTIDADYRGEVKIPLVNLGRDDFVVERGMRIAQLVIAPVPRVEVVEVERLDATARGTGGFGSTGR